jgi:hypothetical protein
MTVLLAETNQHWEVSVFAAIVLKILHLSIKMELAQNDMTNRHGKCGVCALFRVQPQIGEFGGF